MGKISEYSEPTNLSRSAQFPITQDGDAYKTTAEDVLALGSAGVRVITADDNIVATDAGKILEVNSSSDVVLTIAALSDFPIGSCVTVVQKGTGNVSIVAGSGATINGNLETTEQYGALFIYKSASGVYISPGGTGSSSGGGGTTQLSTPTLTMTVDSDTEITFDWTNVANEDSYTVQIAEDSGFTTGVQTATPAANDTSHQFTGLTPETLYYGRVKAEGSGSYTDSNYGTDSATTEATGGGETLEDLVFTAVTAGGALTNTSQVISTSATGDSFGNEGTDPQSLLSGQDGYIQAQYQSTADIYAFLGFCGATYIPVGYANYDAAFYIEPGGVLKVIDDGSGLTPIDISHTVSVGDYVRIERTGSTFKLRTSPDGTTWTDRHTYTYAYSGQVWIMCDIYGGDGTPYNSGRLYHPKGYNINP